MSVFCLVPKIVLWKGVGQVPLIQNLLQAQRVLNPRVVLTKRFSLWTRKQTGTVVLECFEVYALKGLSHEIDFKNVDNNSKNLA
jgi:hypothetical protein